MSEYIRTNKFDTNECPNIFVKEKLIRTNVRIYICDQYKRIFEYIRHTLYQATGVHGVPIWTCPPPSSVLIDNTHKDISLILSGSILSRHGSFRIELVKSQKIKSQMSCEISNYVIVKSNCVDRINYILLLSILFTLTASSIPWQMA